MHGRLAGRLTRAVTRSRLGNRVGVVVLDERGTTLYAHQADVPLLPASTQKLLTAGAALARLGSGHRFVTAVHATDRPNKRGVVDGDLVLVGSGDPALAGPTFAAVEPERPRTPLERLARHVRRAGVRRVTGRVIGDPSVFAPQPAAAGWLQRYFDQLDATRVSGLTVDGGRRLFVTGGLLQAEAAKDPALQAARSLRTLLRVRGVRVDGGVATARRPAPARGGGTTARRRANTRPVARIASPRLEVLLRHMLRESDNAFADTIFRAVGAAAGDATWTGAARAAHAALTPLELDWSGVVVADGSGLSRANRASPSFLAGLQAGLWGSSLGPRWRGLLPVAGDSGTLRYRLRGTVAEHRLYGKTGSLLDVRSLVGTVVGPDGRARHLAVVGNRLGPRATTTLRDLADDVAAVSAEELYSCRRVRAPLPAKRDGKVRGARPPLRLICAG